MGKLKQLHIDCDPDNCKVNGGDCPLYTED